MAELIENQQDRPELGLVRSLVAGQPARQVRGRATPRGGLPARDLRPVAPTPYSFLALPEAGR